MSERTPRTYTRPELVALNAWHHRYDVPRKTVAKPQSVRNTIVNGALTGLGISTAFALFAEPKDVQAALAPVASIAFPSQERSVTLEGYKLDDELESQSTPWNATQEDSEMAATVEEPSEPRKTIAQVKETATSSKLQEAIARNPDYFSKTDIESANIYESIYEAAGKAYGVDPILLLITHKKETTYSLDKATDKTVVYLWDYDSNGKPIYNYLYGATQRSTNFFSDAQAEAALLPLPENVKTLPTRVKTDAREIAWTAMRMSELLEQTGGNLLAALKKYCAEEFAIERWELYNLYKKVLNSQS